MDDAGLLLPTFGFWILTIFLDSYSRMLLCPSVSQIHFALPSMHMQRAYSQHTLYHVLMDQSFLFGAPRHPPLLPLIPIRALDDLGLSARVRCSRFLHHAPISQSSTSERYKEHGKIGVISLYKDLTLVRDG